MQLLGSQNDMATIRLGVLTVDEDMDEVWCLEDENRTHPILDAVGKEVRHLFPEEIARELRNGNGDRGKKTSAA